MLVAGAAFALLIIRSYCLGPILTGTGLAVVTQVKLVLPALHSLEQGDKTEHLLSLGRYIVLTTSAGIMDHEEARRKHTGGKILGFFF